MNDRSGNDGNDAAQTSISRFLRQDCDQEEDMPREEAHVAPQSDGGTNHVSDGDDNSESYQPHRKKRRKMKGTGLSLCCIINNSKEN